MAYMRYYRSLLNEREKEAYDKLVEGIARRDDKIRVNKINEKELERVHTAVNYDYPDFFYVDFYNYRYTLYPFSTEIEIYYTMDVYSAKKFKRQIDQKASQIVAGAIGLSELEMEEYLNDEIRKMAVYDRNPADEFNAQHLIGTFIDGKCVCEGFAKSFKYLADMLELKSLIVVGNSGVKGDIERHAWNMVRIDGESYHIDVTYNDVQRDERTGRILHFSRAYFNLSDKEICRDHTIETMFKMPPCQKSKSQVPIISSTSALIDYLKKESKLNKKFSELRLTKRFEIDDIIELISNEVTPKDYGWYNKIQTYYLSNYSLLIEWH